MFQVGEVSRRLGLNPQTLYFYERIGLIPSPQRTEAGYRLFSQQDMERLAFISRAKSLGLTLDEN
jgi:MerR family Zn(II)-responsive transcriptional regulator of zntA